MKRVYNIAHGIPWVILLGISLCMRPANERWLYNVTSSLIGWAHTQNDPCFYIISTSEQTTYQLGPSFYHDDVIKWKHFPRYWPFVRGIHRSPFFGEFPSQRSVMQNFDVFFDLRPNKLLSKQSWGWWFETPLRPLWRHRNDLVRSAWSMDHGSTRKTSAVNNPTTTVTTLCDI